MSDNEAASDGMPDIGALLEQLEEGLRRFRRYEAQLGEGRRDLVKLVVLLQRAEDLSQEIAETAAAADRALGPQLATQMSSLQTILRSWRARFEGLDQSRLHALEETRVLLTAWLEKELAQLRGQPGEPASAEPVATPATSPRETPGAAARVTAAPSESADPSGQDESVEPAPPAESSAGPAAEAPSRPSFVEGALLVELTARPLESEAAVRKLAEGVQRIPGVQGLAVQSFQEKAATLRFESTDEAELVVGLQSMQPGAQVRVVSVHDNAVTLSLELPLLATSN